MKLAEKDKVKINYALENFSLALGELNEAIVKPKLSKLEVAGTIQHFEFSYELAWKLLQKRAGIEGRMISTPKEAFRYGFEQGYLIDEKIWAEMIDDRNETVHTYDRETADRVLNKIKLTYVSRLNYLENQFKVEIAD